MRLIDADALIEDIDGDLTDSIAEGRAIEKIMNAPTIEERKKGKWKLCEEKTEETFWVGSRCSECNYWKPMGQWNYCPNCGADMRGETWELPEAIVLASCIIALGLWFNGLAR